MNLRYRVMIKLASYEKKHIDYLRANAAECALFLKRDDAFPVNTPGSVALYGNGARNTVKGGPGSGDVDSRFFASFEEGFKEAGFRLISENWLNSYDRIFKENYKKYVKETKTAARKAGYMALVFSMGYFPAEPEYNMPLSKEADIAVYVLARNSGEGNDRRLIPGDVYLSETEIRDILWLNENYERFMLVLNVGGVMDLTPIASVRNILYISQLGVVTGNILPDIILGRANPSGKLTTSWARPEDYSTFENFGKLQEVEYKEGIFVGYRFFDGSDKKPLYPFGYGRSYSDFEIGYESARMQDSRVIVRANVTNVSEIPGKEVVQLYMAEPAGELPKAVKQLVSFVKTRELGAGEAETVELSFDMKAFAAYSEEKAAYILEKGDYILKIGNSSDNVVNAVCIRLESDVTVRQCRSKMGKPGFADYVPSERRKEFADGIDVIVMDAGVVETEIVIYKRDEYKEPALDSLTDEELMKLTLGHHGKGFAAIVGESCVHAVGAAGETCLSVSAVDKSITMADGPAGLRLKSAYGIDEKGIYNISIDPMWKKMMEFLPKASELFMKPPKNRHGEVHYQYTTAIPIGTAIAQSFNLEFATELGNLVAEEMDMFGVDLWLAPALNIHRNICCGRNFEYYSEDPLVSGKMATAITKGVQSHPGRGTTIKHVLCNNQELNRNNGDSRVSERALREIYLRGFEICIKEADPKALMTSYNLVNGIHTSESYDLVNDILRCELKYTGLIMTDWIASGRTLCRKAVHPAPYAHNNILAGNDLTMPGSAVDEKDIMKALKNGILSREDLLISASRIVRSIKEMKGPGGRG